MQPNIRDNKKALRARVRERLSAMSFEEREQDSEKACTLLAAQAVWQNAASVLLFAPLPEELDVWPLLMNTLLAGKLAALPRFDRETGAYAACRVQNLAADLRPGRYGIREPAEECEIISGPLDLILVPGVAFSLTGHRLGRGAGYYDRLLENLDGSKCGVAFDQQIVEEIPLESHDLRMDYILTPTRWTKAVA